MEVNITRRLNDFRYLDYYWCETKGAPFIKSTRQEYSEDYNEYLDINHIWRGKNLYDWIIQAYNAGKNGEELKFVVHTEDTPHHFYRFKADEQGNILNKENKIVGKYEDTYWGEILPYLDKDAKPEQISQEEEVLGVHYAKNKDDYRDINISWENVEKV